jgi:hypothetical protein
VSATPRASGGNEVGWRRFVFVPMAGDAQLCGVKRGNTMLRMLAIVLFAAYAGAAYAGGGGAEPMPEVGYTDLPGYHPSPGYRHIKHWYCCRRHLSTAHPG